ncbi:(2Fe-2S)-binding protein [Tomitella fengzijianii]|nr:(2Fe-2S)-binding protein [Tomitella fengzijianii]
MGDRLPPRVDAFSGEALRDGAWLARQVSDTRRRWRFREDRAAGTLWWYSASATLTAPGPRMLLADGTAPNPALAQLDCTLTPYGHLGSARSAGWVSGPDEYRRALVPAFAAIIGALARASGAPEPSLWAIASDSLANQALQAGVDAGRCADACVLARRLTCPPLVPARFVDVVPHPSAPHPSAPLAMDGAARVSVRPADPASPPPAGGLRIVRRSSCCLLFQAPGQGKCVSCPRRSPGERAAALGGWFAGS